MFRDVRPFPLSNMHIFDTRVSSSFRDYRGNKMFILFILFILAFIFFVASQRDEENKVRIFFFFFVKLFSSSERILTFLFNCIARRVSDHSEKLKSGLKLL